MADASDGRERDEVSEERFVEAAEKAARWIAEYRLKVGDLPVLSRARPGEIAAALPPEPPEEPDDLDAVLRDVDALLVPGLTHWNHPGFFAYFCSSTTDAGVLAELLAAELNQNAMLWRTSPAGTELEHRMVDWVRRFVHLPPAFRGLILDTASSSSFTALLAARERAVPGVRRFGLSGRSEIGPCVLYLSEEAHGSLDKSALAAGLGLEQVRRIAVDERLRMKPEALERAIEEDRTAARIPVMVCATIGTTSTTSVDPVGAVAEVCTRTGVWLHVDAAYAGPAASLPEKRAEFEGWERADSIVLNPHKWLSTPIDCSILLYRDDEAMRRPLALTPEYLSSSQDGRNLMDIGLSLGRRFRALKLWFQFRLEGATAIRSRLRSHIASADALARRIESDPRFELLAPHPFSLVVFRALPPPGSDRTVDEWNRTLLEAVNRRGSVFLSHTIVRNQFAIRVAVGSARSTDDSVLEAWRVLTEEHDLLARGATA